MQNRTDLNIFENLQEANAQLDAIIESSFDGIYITDGNANTIKVNKAYETITGLKREEVLNHNMRDLVASHTISTSGSLRVLEEKNSVTLFQEFKTGKKALISSSPVFNENNEIIMVVTNVRDITEIYKLREEILHKEEETRKLSATLRLIGSNNEIYKNLIAVDYKTLNVLNMALKVSKVDTTVVLLGETGVGKEVFAEYIYKNSLRSNAPFIKVNCGAIPETLMESEFFGYEKGAFTGANKEGKIGLFEAADKGTIFLDEIGELPLNMQVKLLRVFQEQEIERIGSTKPTKINVRVIAATNRNLFEMTEARTFRLDLYYRLMVFPINIPPLRERPLDILPLAELFLENANKKYRLNRSFSREALEVLESYTWPGNIRELKNIVERALLISNGDIITSNLLTINSVDNSSDNVANNAAINLNSIIEKIELDYINRAYNKYKNVRAAAASLGMTPSTFVRKRQKYSKK
ncbi:sigma-54 interaction domain-containing protein [Alloiococcus sp. CFN-8]|uniref:sigma-54 interaction domain-containing protein n=1 Tax=Alloiococcus sp. CFN-8 TaxID=3416081 RepID=UPI003CEF81DE